MTLVRTGIVAPIVVALLALVLTSWPSAAQAYSCPGQPVRAYVDQADVVLVGTAHSATGSPWSWLVGARAEVQVERYLKGTGPGVVVVTPSAPFPSSLGYRATGWPEQWTGQRGVLFLTGGGGWFHTDVCGGTRWTYPPEPEQLEAFLSEVQAVTGPGSPPEPVALQSGGIPLVIAAAGVLVAVVAGGLAHVRRSRRLRRLGEVTHDDEA